MQLCGEPIAFSLDCTHGVCIQVSEKYGVIYVVTKMGLLFVYDLETASAIYRNRISPDPIFLTSDAPSCGGFYAINRRGQVLLCTLNDEALIPFISGQLKNLDLALALAQVGTHKEICMSS